MDPVALNVLNYFPLPNQPGNAVTGAQNYFATGTAELNVDNIDGRVDHQLSDNQKMFVRYSYRKTFSAPASFFPEDIAIAEGRVNEQNLAHNSVIDYNRTMSNTTVLTRGSGSRGRCSSSTTRASASSRRASACRRRSTTTSIG